MAALSSARERVRGVLSADGRLAFSPSLTLPRPAPGGTVRVRDIGYTLRVWDTASGQSVRALNRPINWLTYWFISRVIACAVSADGRLALSASWDQTLRVWDTVSGKEITRWTHDISLTRCALSANGHVVMVGDEAGGAHFLDVAGVAGAASTPAAATTLASGSATHLPNKPSLLRRLFGGT
jgi:WD40 repeat protein